MSGEEIEDILQGVQVGDVKDFDAHVLRAAFADVVARAEAAEAALATARAEVDRLRVFASHVGTIVQANPSDLKGLEAALKRIILTIGAQRWTVDDVARLDDELREKMSRALEGARATARAEGAAAERTAVVAELKAREAAALGRSGAAQEGAREAGCDDWDEAGLADWGAAEALRDLAAYIAVGAHVRPVEGA